METTKKAEPIDASNRSTKQHRGRLPLVVAAIVLALIGLNYYLYVRSKTQYYTTRDLRMLALLGRQVDDALKSHRQFVRNFAEDRDVFKEFESSDFVYDKLNESQRKIANLSFPGFTWMSRDPKCAADQLPPSDHHDEAFVEEIVEINGESWLRLAYRGSRLGTDVFGCGKVRLANVLQAAFRASMVEPFDTVMLVDGTGAVLHRATPQHQSVARGFGAARTAHDAAYRRDVFGSTVDVRLNTLTALSEKSGWTSSKPFDLSSLGATRNTEVSIADTGYFLFAQPSPVSVPRQKTATVPTTTTAIAIATATADTKDEKKGQTTVASDPNRWSFVALVAKRRFMYEALAISETVLAAVAALLLLLVAAWPFMRLSLISEFKPVRIADVIFLAVSTTLAAAIFTIAVADAVVYRRLDAISDVHLRQFAVSLEAFFDKEILNALKAMDHIDKTWNWEKEGETQNAGDFEGHDYDYMRDDKDIRHPLNVGTYFSTFSWIDRNGVQEFKRSVKEPMPRVVVADRDYFNRVLNRRMWLAREDGSGIVWPFALESLRSMTTGKPEVVVASPTRSKQYPVLAMTLSASQLIDPVLPAGFTFAVIDDRGSVLFHSDTDKNVLENFFEESDQNRQFRSAVFARHTSHVDLRYEGQDYRAYVAPMKHLPWMMVILRHKQLLRTMNAETIVITMMCLAFLVAGSVVLTFVIVLLRPRYRAPWLWPDYKRGKDYGRLCLALTFLVFAGLVTLMFYEAVALIIASFILPLVALVTTFGALHRRGGWIFAATVTFWLALAGVWVYVLTLKGQTTPTPIHSDDREVWLVGAAVVGALLLMSGFLALRRWSGGTSAAARRAHMGMAALLLVTMAIIPTLGFYKAAYRLEIQNLIKYSQLTFADRLQQRTETVVEAGYRPMTSFARRWEVPAAFSTSWWLLPQKQRAPAHYDCKPSEDQVLLPEFLEEFLPQYSEYSVAMREMHHDTASNEKWWWCRDGVMLALHKNIRLSPKVMSKLWPEKAAESTWRGPLPLRDPMLIGPDAHPLGRIDFNPDEDWPESAQVARADRAVTEMVISSVVPSIVPPAMRAEFPLAYPTHPFARRLFAASQVPREPPLSRALRIGVYALAVGVLAALLWWALTFITKVIFLTDIRGPLWLSKKLRPRIGDPIFLVRREGGTLDALCESGFHRIQLIKVTTDDDLEEKLTDIDRLPPGSCVLIEDFEEDLSAAACARKLRLIQHVLYLPQRSVVIVSTISPLTMMAIAHSAGADPEPWKETLRRFIWISDDQLSTIPQDSDDAKNLTMPEQLALLREQWTGFRAHVQSFRQQLTSSFVERMQRFAQSFRREDPAVWTTREAGTDPELKEIAEELKDRVFMSRAEVIDEFSERAASYYDTLWSSCADDDKLILCQLAREGLVNPRNRRSIRRLMGRGLIRRGPQLSLLNESFRKYVLNASVAEDVDVKHVDEHDTWSAISRPLAFVLIAVIVMFLITQKDLANTASAIVTALAGGIPALIKLIGVLTDRKQSAT